MTHTRRLLLAAAAAMTGGALFAAPAVAAGGATIGSAPVISYGTELFGNTLTDNPMNRCASSNSSEPPWSWWNAANLIAGDRLTIDFGGIQDTSAAIYPPGTSDYNLQSANPIDQDSAGNGYGEVVYTAVQDGSVPVEFESFDGDCNGDGVNAGPYNFTAYLSHQIVASLSAHGNTRHHETVFTTSLYNPDGGALMNPSLRVTYYLVSGSHQYKLATKAAPFTFDAFWGRRSRGRRYTIRAVATGSYYRTVARRIVVRGV